MEAGKAVTNDENAADKAVSEEESNVAASSIQETAVPVPGNPLLIGDNAVTKDEKAAETAVNEEADDDVLEEESDKNTNPVQAGDEAVENSDAIDENMNPNTNEIT